MHKPTLPTILKVATRASRLARWQAQHVIQALQPYLPKQTRLEMVLVSTAGDRDKTSELLDIGGKQVFVKSLQQALLHGEADIAVHSAKDLSVFPAQDLSIGSFLPRAEAADVVVCAGDYASLEQLAAGARVGTGSPRRCSQLAQYYSALQACPIRGNVETRLAKLKQGDYDAIILAYAGLERLGLAKVISQVLDKQQFIPAIAQAAIAVECRSQDSALMDALSRIDHRATRLCVVAEQAVNQVLQGDCHSPIGAHAYIDQNTSSLYLQAMVSSTDGGCVLRSDMQAKLDTICDSTNNLQQLAITDFSSLLDCAQRLGEGVGKHLLAQGAQRILNSKH